MSLNSRLESNKEEEEEAGPVDSRRGRHRGLRRHCPSIFPVQIVSLESDVVRIGHLYIELSMFPVQILSSTQEITCISPRFPSKIRYFRVKSALKPTMRTNPTVSHLELVLGEAGVEAGP